MSVGRFRTTPWINAMRWIIPGSRLQRAVELLNDKAAPLQALGRLRQKNHHTYLGNRKKYTKKPGRLGVRTFSTFSDTQ
jgi:hypothetical protein